MKGKVTEVEVLLAEEEEATVAKEVRAKGRRKETAVMGEEEVKHEVPEKGKGDSCKEGVVARVNVVQVGIVASAM